MLKALGDPYFVAKFQRTFGLKELGWEDHIVASGCGEKQTTSSSQTSHAVDQNGCLTRKALHNDTPNHAHMNGFIRPASFEKLVKPKQSKQLYEYNSFFHYIFLFGSALGYEAFYVTFFPYIMWNIDEYLVRRAVVMWALIMYVGQAAKDVIQWPRPPCPPVIALEKRFQEEYGMPSTHAMVGTLVPFCLVYFTYDRYQYPLYAGVMFGVCWCVLVSASRLYVGMHTLQDILAGITYALLLLLTVIPLQDVSVDKWAFTSLKTPVFLVLVPMIMMALYPLPPKHTETKADTAMILFAACGTLLGFWARFYLQGVPDPYLGTPYPILMPSLRELIHMQCKFVCGVAVLVPTRLVMKATVHTVVPWLFSVTDPKQRKSLAEMPHRCLTYAVLGFTASFIVPHMFAYFGV